MKVHYDDGRQRYLQEPGTFACGREWFPRHKQIARTWKRVTCKRCLARRTRKTKEDRV